MPVLRELELGDALRPEEGKNLRTAENSKRCMQPGGFEESRDLQPRKTRLCPVEVCMQSTRVVTHRIDSAVARCAVQSHALRDTVLPLKTARRLRMCYLWQYQAPISDAT